MDQRLRLRGRPLRSWLLLDHEGRRVAVGDLFGCVGDLFGGVGDLLGGGGGGGVAT